VSLAVKTGSLQSNLYGQFVNPQWVKLLDVLQMNLDYRVCRDAELRTADGRTIIDFNSGYCVHNIGHNHPQVVTALTQEIDAAGPAMLQNHASESAGMLAARLCGLAGGGLTKTFFASSGSEGVEAAIKFARAHTKRAGILHAAGGFHGLTCGALSLMSDAFWTDGFGPLLPDTAAVPFGDIAALERLLATRSFAAFIVEPVQAEAGVVVPSAEYLPAAQALCRRHGTLFVLDEVQTGLFRTGRFLAAHHFAVEPDIVVLAKALSGGLIPCSAVLMTERVYASVFSSLRRAIIHSSTFGENGLAMRAGLATLDVLEDERLGERAIRAGQRLQRGLAKRLAGYEMVRDIRGLGLLNAVEFGAPRSLRLRVPYETLAALHPAAFGQILVMRLLRDHGFLSQVCGNNFTVLKVAPPLTVTDAQLDGFVAALGEVVEGMHKSAEFWSHALGIARRALTGI